VKFGEIIFGGNAKISEFGLKEFTNIQKTGKPAKIAPRDITINTPDL
jgi:hypothetical protein